MTDAAPLPDPKRRLPPIFWVLIVLLVALLAVGIGSLAYYARLTYGPKEALWAEPWDMPEPERINAGLAVWSLAGTEPSKVYQHAMAGKELDTVAALALLTPRLPSGQRLGWLDVLAQRYAPIEREADARVFLRYTTDLAMLLPDIDDQLRADILLKAAEEWRALGEEENARWTLEQTLVLAQYSPYLTKPARKQLFLDIGDQFVQLGDSARGQAVAAIPVLTEGVPQPPVSTLTSVLSRYPERPPSLEKLIADREAAAQAYVDDWNQRGGQAAAGVTSFLNNRLVDEDLGRDAFYDEVFSRESLAPDEQTRALFDRIEWYAIRYRAASRLYGASITPDWEAKRMDLGIALRDAIVALHNRSNDWVASLPADQQPEARVAMDRLIFSWAAIGLYVGANVDLLSDTMNQDIAALNATGVFPRSTVENGRARIELFYKTPPAPGDISQRPPQQ